MLKRLAETANLIGYCLLPSRHWGDFSLEGTEKPSPQNIKGYATVSPKKITCLAGDSWRAVDPHGSLALFFPDAYPIAAPFILFRLKRTGFSGCRVEVTEGGLAVFAMR